MSVQFRIPMRINWWLILELVMSEWPIKTLRFWMNDFGTNWKILAGILAQSKNHFPNLRFSYFEITYEPPLWTFTELCTITDDILENDRTHWRSEPGNVPRAVRYKETWFPDSSGSLWVVLTHYLWFIQVTAVREIKVRDPNAGETTPNQRRLKLRVRTHLSKLVSKWHKNAIVDKTVL